MTIWSVLHPRVSPYPYCRISDYSMLLYISVQFSSVQDGIYALGKAHIRSTPSLRSFPNVAFEAVPLFV